MGFLKTAVRVAKVATNTDISAGRGGPSECVVCGKTIRAARKVGNNGRVCSVACAHFWVESMG